MAESKFLTWQDMDNDGLIDKCDDLFNPEPAVCPGCLPNPMAIPPNWKKRNINEPFLNEKMCEYQITKITRYKTTIPKEILEADPNSAEAKKALEDRFYEHVEEAIMGLLDYYNKDDSPTSIKEVWKWIKYSKYDLQARKNSRLKLLYAVPFNVIFDLPDREDDDADEEEENLPGEMTVMYSAADVSTKMIKIRKALGLYGRYLKVERALGNGNIFFQEDDRVFNLQDYGDIALWTDSIMSNLYNQLEGFLSMQGYQLPGGFAAIFSTKERITKFEIKYDNYEVKRMKVWTESCGNRPIWFKKKRLKALRENMWWKDKTAVAYFAQLYEMESNVSARIPLPWQEFIEKFTYPKVYVTVAEEVKGSVASCVSDALQNELKELGQDILDDVFGIGDAIAYQFRKNICRYDFNEIRDDERLMGLSYAQDIGAQSGNIMGMAQMQAFKEIGQSDQIFTQMCGRMLANMTGWGPASSSKDVMFKHGWERLKICGLFDFLMQAMECLMNGLQIEEVLTKALEAAFKAMSIENFGELFIGLPPEKQAELDALVQKKINEGTLVPPGSVGTVTKWSKPWENPEIIANERTSAREGGLESGVPGPSSYNEAASSSNSQDRRTLAKQFDTIAGAAEDELNPDIIMEAYALALIEHYSENLLGLVDQLNKFPGAPLIAGALAAFDCPRPPLFNPSLLDFIKSLGFDWCRNMNEIRTPRLENPFEFIPKLKDITYWLWEAIKYAITQMIVTILMKLMIKICEIIGDAICAGIGALGAGLGALLTGGNFFEAIRESICGPDADDDQVQATIDDIMTSLGPGGAALANRDQLNQFVEDMSSSSTQKELFQAFLGEPDPQMLEVIDQLIEFEYPEYREGLPNSRALARFFKNCGNLMPLDFRQKMRDAVNELPDLENLPANPTLCATPEQLEQFKQLRAQLLGDPAADGPILERRATPEQIEQMYEDLRTGYLDDFSSLGNVLQGGVGKFIEDNMPPLVSQPGCDDGLIPFESREQQAAASLALEGSFEQLRIDYAEDMMGNGNFWNSDSAWGLINMCLSDTESNPLTNHYRRARNNKDYVHFATNIANGGETATGFFSFLQPNATFSQQHGQFPLYVASWLRRQFLNAGGGTNGEDSPMGGVLTYGGLDLSGGTVGVAADGTNFVFDSGNSIQGERKYTIDFDQLDWNVYGSGIDRLALPDFGYNCKLRTNFSAERFTIIKSARKGGKSDGDTRGFARDGADIAFNYKDNAAGMRNGCGRGTDVEPFPISMGETEAQRRESTWSYGFDQQNYFSDIVREEVYIPIPERFLPAQLKGKGWQPQSAEEAGPNADAWIEARRAAQAAGYTSAGTKTETYHNRADDNIRVKIVEKINYGANVESPLNASVGQDWERSDAFDIPDWIESIPLVGWAIQGLINLVLLPVTNLARLLSGVLRDMDSDHIYRERKYEFMCVDDGLDGFYGTSPTLDFTDYPKFYSCFRTHQEYLPQVVLLGELTGNSTDKAGYDLTMTNLFKKFALEIGRNKQAWQYGAKFDFLRKSDLDYLAPEGAPRGPGGKSQAGIPYDLMQVYDRSEDIFGNTVGWRDVENEDMIMGVSRDEYENGRDNARVFYLNPAQHGRSYTSPGLYIKEVDFDGWMGLAQAWFPEISPCSPSKGEIIDWDEIKKQVNERLPRIPEDPRLNGPADCAVEVPYNRILNRTARAGLYGVIDASIRIFAATHMFKCLATFTTVMPKFPDNFSGIYSSYIIEEMERTFKDAQGGFWELFNSFKDEEFWYAFLEQSVQYYAWQVDEGYVEDPPEAVLAALMRLNDLQDNYDLPWREDLRDARQTGDAGIFQSLGSYRHDRVLETVKATEEDAKLILKELINQHMTSMGEKIVSNLADKGFIPKIFDLDYWLFGNMCPTVPGVGGLTTTDKITFAGPKFKEVRIGLPDQLDPNWPGPFYAEPHMLRVAVVEDADSLFGIGDDYVGYYYGVIDEDGDVQYRAGEFPAGGEDGPSGDILVPLAHKVYMATVDEARPEPDNSGAEGSAGEGNKDFADRFPEDGRGATAYSAPSNLKYIGDIPDFMGGAPASMGDAETPFFIEKYISINGVKMSTSAALSAIKNNPPDTLISEAYPGNMQLTKNKAGKITGIKGKLGVRYGIRFGYQGKELTAVEVDSLDVRCSAAPPLEGSSKLLLCLINKLKNDDMYKLVMSYVFPIKKVTSLLAIYNDMAFLSAIGEVTVGNNDDTRWVPMGTVAAAIMDGISTKNKSNFLNLKAVNSDGSLKSKGLWEKAMIAKPGRMAYIHENEPRYQEYPDPNWFWLFGETYEKEIITINQKKSGIGGTEGWQHYDDRQPGWFSGIWVKEWDSWDRQILRNSASRIKVLFKTYYYSRDFKPGDSGDMNAADIWIKNLRSRLFPSPGAGLLSWFQRGKLRSNPFDANGKMCKK